MSEHELWGGVRRAQPMQEFRRVMREKGITAAELARRLEVSPSHISELLRGRKNVTIDQLYLIADALEVGLSITIASVSV